MAELDKAELHLLASSAAQESLIRGWIRAWFWQWYRDHEEEEVVTVRVLFLRKTIRVRDLRGLFSKLIGEPDA